MKTFIKKAFSVLFIYSIIYSKICGQSADIKTITIKEALAIANESSALLRNEKLKIDYMNTLTKTAYDLQNTNINSEFGQFNSNLFDIKIGVSQNLKFPSVYKKQKKLLEEEAKTALIDASLLKKDINKQVTELFYDMLYLDEKRTLLSQIDSVFTKYLVVANQQFEKGETNILEKSEVENQLYFVKIQLKEIENDYQFSQVKFKYLINTEANYKPIATSIRLGFNSETDIIDIDNQYIIKQLNQEKQINLAKIEVEKAKNIPELQAGIYAQSFKFNTPDQANFLGTIGQLGLSFPFFNSSFKNKKVALEIANKITENKLSIESKSLHLKFQEHLSSIKKHTDTVNYYENVALKNSEIIEKMGGKQFANGEIKFGQMAFLFNQNIQLKSNYLDAVNDLNRAIIKIKYLTNE